MRTFKAISKMKTIIETTVICDDCGKDCSNCNMEMKLQFSFSEHSEHFKDVCLDCWDKKYKKEWSERKSHDFEEMLKANKEEKKNVE